MNAAQIVPAHAADSHAELRAARRPGSFFIAKDDERAGEFYFWYVCPCGQCRRLAVMEVGKGFKPNRSPSWHWDGNIEKPTLHPSVNLQGHWHGWLRSGEWSHV